MPPSTRLRRPREPAAARRAVHQHRIAAAVEHGGHPFIEVELLDHSGGQRRRTRAQRRGTGRGARGFRQQRIIHAQHEVAFEHPHGTRRLRQHDGAAQLAAVRVEVRLRADIDAYDLGRHGAVRAAGPGLGVADDRHHARLDQLRVEPLQRPPRAERKPLFADVLDAPLAQLPPRPTSGRLHRWGSGQPRAVDIAEPAGQLHYLGAVQPLVLDGRYRGAVELARRRRGGGCRRNGRRKRARKQERACHGGEPIARRRRPSRPAAAAHRCRQPW